MSILLLTMCHQADIEWLRRWIAHNEKFAKNRGDLMVIMDGYSAEMDAVAKGCSVIKLSLSAEQRSNFDRKRLIFIHKIINSFLNLYRYVVFTDVDEFILLHPDSGKDLVCYLDEKEHDGIALSPVGLELLFQQNDPPLNPDLPLLKQRQYGFLSEAYCKPCIVHRNIKRGHQHKIVGDKWTIDNNIFLFHGKFADENLFEERRIERHKTKEKYISKQHRTWDYDVAERELRRVVRRFLSSEEEVLSPRTVEPYLVDFKREREETGRVSFKTIGRFRIPEELTDLL